MACLWKYSVVAVLFVMGLSLTGADYSQYVAFLKEQSENKTFVRLFEEHAKLFQDKDTNLKAQFDFTCQSFPKPKTEALSVHELTPMDIKVVAAMGDSITAGTGITAATPLGLLREDRQLSWSIGGENSITEEKTLPNILKFYNPEVTGYSTGWGPVWLEAVSHLNVADPGDKSEDMPGQAKLLVERMQKAGNFDFDKDWKMITMFIGGNDLCDYCDDKVKYSAENYRDNLKTALDYLHEKVPRAFVNLVQVLDIALVKRLNANLICDTLHLFGCRCAAFPSNSQAELDLQAETDRYRKLTEELIMSGRYDDKEDFTVMLQPFFSKTILPNEEGTDDPDLSYFAPDCFHLSLKGHRAATEALWDNMVEPVGKKRVSWTPNEQLECPTQAKPYFYTYKNSGLSNKPNTDNKQSLGLGAVRQNGEQEASNNENTNSAQQSVSMTTGALLTGSIVVLIGLVVGVVVLKKKRRENKDERQILLTADDMRIYA